MGRLGALVRRYRLDAKFVFLVGGILVIGLLYGFNYIVQREARQTATNAATIAARVANRKLQTASDLLATNQHTATATSFKQSRAACGRNNVLRAHLQAITANVKDLEGSLAKSRLGAAKIDLTPALAAHDRRSAAHYLELLGSLKDTNQIDCVAKFPDPFPKTGHH